MTHTINRRGFFHQAAGGIYGAALTALLGRDLYGSEQLHGHDLKPRSPHFQPKAKAVIHLFMNGGPSQVDLFDPKPMLSKFAGSAAPRDIVNQIEFTNQVGGLLPSPFKFARHGKSGTEVSELLPHLSTCVDDIALVRSMYGEHFNHE